METNEYRTSDLYEASALVTCGFDVLRLEPTSRGPWEFLFSTSEALFDVVNEFSNGRLMVNLKIYMSAWRQLRRRLDQEGMRNGNERYNHRK
jgi:hypothetical protein